VFQQSFEQLAAAPVPSNQPHSQLHSQLRIPSTALSTTVLQPVQRCISHSKRSDSSRISEAELHAIGNVNEPK
jgi:hypothetical protein